jgi:hypothetical protein
MIILEILPSGGDNEILLVLQKLIGNIRRELE